MKEINLPVLQTMKGRTLVHIESANMGDSTPCGEHFASVPKSKSDIAEEIVLRCNAFPELLEALKLCRRTLTARGGCTERERAGAVKAARAAIAKAQD